MSSSLSQVFRKKKVSTKDMNDFSRDGFQDLPETFEPESDFKSLSDSDLQHLFNKNVDFFIKVDQFNTDLSKKLDLLNVLNHHSQKGISFKDTISLLQSEHSDLLTPKLYNDWDEFLHIIYKKNKYLSFTMTRLNEYLEKYTEMIDDIENHLIHILNEAFSETFIKNIIYILDNYDTVEIFQKSYKTSDNETLNKLHTLSYDPELNFVKLFNENFFSDSTYDILKEIQTKMINMRSSSSEPDSKKIKKLQNQIKNISQDIQNAMKENNRKQIMSLMNKRNPLQQELNKLLAKQSTEDEVPRKECNNKICDLENGSKGIEDPYSKECENAKDLVHLSDEYCYNTTNPHGIRKILIDAYADKPENMHRRPFEKSDYTKVLGDHYGNKLYEKQTNIRASRKKYKKLRLNAEAIKKEKEILEDKIIPFLNVLEDSSPEDETEITSMIKNDLFTDDLPEVWKDYMNQMLSIGFTNKKTIEIQTQQKENDINTKETEFYQLTLKCCKELNNSFPDLREAVIYIQNTYFNLDQFMNVYEEQNEEPSEVNILHELSLHVKERIHEEWAKFAYQDLEEIFDNSINYNTFFVYKGVEELIQKI